MNEGEFVELQKDVVRLLTILVKRNSTQTPLIQKMNSVGFAPKRIAELLDTTPNTVSVSLHYGKKTKSKGGSHGK